MKKLLLFLFLFALAGLTGCQSGKHWLSVDHVDDVCHWTIGDQNSPCWPASPAAQLGVPDGDPWLCNEGYGPTGKGWNSRLGKDGYYWCWRKDEPKLK